MKLIIAIIANKDVEKVIAALVSEGFFATRFSVRGQFLINGNTAVLISLEKDRLEQAYEIIEKNVTKRIVRRQGVESTVEGTLLKQPVDVEENGAVAVVIDVEDFKKF